MCQKETQECLLKILNNDFKINRISYNNVAYRYFKNDCKGKNGYENLFSGGIWFASPNTNRLNADTREYRDDNNERILVYTLSLSLLPPEKTKIFKEWLCIKIHDLEKYMLAIQNDILNPHQISFFNEKEFISQAKEKGCKELPFGTDFKNDPANQKEHFNYITFIDLREMPYYNPENNILKPLSPEAIARASNKDHKYEDEAEIRIELNTTALLDENKKNNYPLSHNHIEYIKLHCPSTSAYCEKINIKETVS